MNVTRFEERSEIEQLGDGGKKIDFFLPLSSKEYLFKSVMGAEFERKEIDVSLFWNNFSSFSFFVPSFSYFFLCGMEHNFIYHKE